MESYKLGLAIGYPRPWFLINNYDEDIIAFKEDGTDPLIFEAKAGWKIKEPVSLTRGFKFQGSSMDLSRDQLCNLMGEWIRFYILTNYANPKGYLYRKTWIHQTKFQGYIKEFRSTGAKVVDILKPLTDGITFEVTVVNTLNRIEIRPWRIY